ncbi:MAG: 4-oxalocrotonate tautomerase family protein [Nitrospirota bacterium]
MPYVNIQITREGATVEQKAELIQGVTDLLARVLNKNPATTFVVIQEIDTDSWGVAGMPVTKYRRLEREAVEMGGGKLGRAQP